MAAQRVAAPAPGQEFKKFPGERAGANGARFGHVRLASFCRFVGQVESRNLGPAGVVLSHSLAWPEQMGLIRPKSGRASLAHLFLLGAAAGPARSKRSASPNAR